MRLLLKKAEIKESVRVYVSAHGVTSTRAIASAIAGQLGYRPSQNTIALVLRELGYEPKMEMSWWKKQ